MYIINYLNITDARLNCTVVVKSQYIWALCTNGTRSNVIFAVAGCTFQSPVWWSRPLYFLTRKKIWLPFLYVVFCVSVWFHLCAILINIIYFQKFPLSCIGVGSLSKEQQVTFISVTLNEIFYFHLQRWSLFFLNAPLSDCLYKPMIWDKF